MSTKDYLEKDYYKVLGVAKTASADEIKQSYRKLARKYHPDANKGDSKSEERFKEISEAYNVLSDEKRRKEYDEARTLFGADRFRVGTPGGGPAAAVSASISATCSALLGTGGRLGDLLGGMFGGRGTQQRPAPRHRCGDRGHAFVQRRGRRRHGSAAAHRRGPVPDLPWHRARSRARSRRVCPSCEGSGQASKNLGSFGISEPCKECRGRGLIADDPCPSCSGSGRAMSTRTIQARIPAGVKDGQRIRLKGKGAPGERGGPAGDLYVHVHVKPHPIFGRSG